MTTADQKLREEFERQKAKIRADISLSWERRELQIRALGQKYDRERKALEQEVER